MNSPCFYHSNVPAAVSCINCGIPICSDCNNNVAGRSACKNCVPTLRARFPEEEMAMAGASASNSAYGSQSGGQSYQNAPSWENPNTTYQPQPGQYAQAPTQFGVAKPPMSFAMHLLIGTGAGLLVGLLGALGWEKFVFYTGWNIGYLTALVGFGVGFGVAMGSQRTGNLIASIAAVLAFFAQMFGYYLLVSDYIARDDPGLRVPVAAVFSALPKAVDPMGWVIIMVGCIGAFNAVIRMPKFAHEQ